MDDKSRPLVSPNRETETQATSAPRPSLPRTPLPLYLPVLNNLRKKRVILASGSPRRKHLLAQIGLPVEVIPSDFPENLPKASLTPWEYVLETATQKALTVYRFQVANPQPGKADPDLVIAADTIVVGTGGEILEKPRSERQHVEMLTALRDGGKRGGDAALSHALGGQDDAILGLGRGIRGEGAGISNAASQSAAKKDGVWHRVYTAVAVVAPLESAKDPGYVLEKCFEETAVKFDPTTSDDMILAYVRTREGADKAGGYGIQGIGSLLVERIDGTWDNVVGLPLRATLRLIDKVLKESKEDAMNDDDDDSDNLVDVDE